MEIEYVELGGYDEDEDNFFKLYSDEIESVHVTKIIGDLIQDSKLQLTIVLSNNEKLLKSTVSIDDDEEDE